MMILRGSSSEHVSFLTARGHLLITSAGYPGKSEVVSERFDIFAALCGALQNGKVTVIALMKIDDDLQRVSFVRTVWRSSLTNTVGFRQRVGCHTKGNVVI